MGGKREDGTPKSSPVESTPCSDILRAEQREKEVMNLEQLERLHEIDRLHDQEIGPLDETMVDIRALMREPVVSREGLAEGGR